MQKNSLHKCVAVLPFAVAVLVSSCVATQEVQKDGPRVFTDEGSKCHRLKNLFTDILENYQNRIDIASQNYQIEQWKLETADVTASDEKLSQLFAELQRVTYDPDILKSVRKAQKDAAEVNDNCRYKTLYPRAKELLETTILTDPKVIQKEKENADLQEMLVKKSNAFRISLPGEAEPVSEAIFQKELAATESRKKREDLYKLFNFARALKWQEWGFKNLVIARNEEAKLAGFKNYYEYRFSRNQLNLENYRNMVKVLKEQFSPKVRKAVENVATKLGIKEMEPWDFRYVRERAANGRLDEYLKSVGENLPLNLAKKFYGELGFTIDDYKFKMDLFPRNGKNTHAFAMSVMFPRVDQKGDLLPEPPMDIRFLANLKKPVEWEDVRTVIHEMGHAVNFVEVRQPYGIFRGTDSVETEAIAMTMERMATTPEFMGATLPSEIGVSLPELSLVLQQEEIAAKTEQAITLLRQVFFSDFEYEIYKDPEQDFAELWSRLNKEYWGFDILPFYADWDIDHFLSSPVYVQNYAIGILMVEQIYESILHEFHTSYRSKDLGTKLREIYFKPGEQYDYQDLTRRFTGKNLSAESAMKLLD
jgi:Zn-dependent oligopeptidase